METPAIRILLITAEQALSTALAEQLCLLDRVELVTTAQLPESTGGGTPSTEGRWAAILLDMDLPGAGPAPWSAVRTAGAEGPVLVLTSRTGESITAEGVELVAKPVRLGALLSRLRELVRRAALPDEAIRLGPYIFRPAEKLLLEPERERRIRLTEKEARILAFLYHAGAEAVTRETLLGQVWGYSAGVTTHTVETHIYRLRRKIARGPSAPELLVTEAGGYRLAL